MDDALDLCMTGIATTPRGLALVAAQVFTCGRDEQTLLKALEQWQTAGFDVQACLAMIARVHMPYAPVIQTARLHQHALSPCHNRA